jgi:hypothetical protein
MRSKRPVTHNLDYDNYSKKLEDTIGGKELERPAMIWRCLLLVSDVYSTSLPNRVCEIIQPNLHDPPRHKMMFDTGWLVSVNIAYTYQESSNEFDFHFLNLAYAI